MIRTYMFSHHTYTVPTPYLVACIHELYFASRDSCPMIDPNVDRNLDAHEACRSRVCSRVRFSVIIAPSIVNYKLLTCRPVIVHYYNSARI